MTDDDMSQSIRRDQLASGPGPLEIMELTNEIRELVCEFEGCHSYDQIAILRIVRDTLAEAGRLCRDPIAASRALEGRFPGALSPHRVDRAFADR